MPMTSSTSSSKPSLHISRHAIERYQQRVDPAVSDAEARIALTRFVMTGRHRPTPRWWMRDHVRAGAGVTFCYCANRADACAIIVDYTVVTVVSRQMFAASKRPTHLRPVSTCRPATASERARWRWDHQIPADLLDAA
jgi:hypothetical protein